MDPHPTPNAGDANDANDGNDANDANDGNWRDLVDQAQSLGFARLGVAAAGPSRHGDRLLAWLAAGRHGTMDYMARRVEARLDPCQSLPGARSVIVLTFPYQDQLPAPDPMPTAPDADGPSPTVKPRGKIARYARGRDYHKVLPPLLRELARTIRDSDRYRTWYTVDTSPLLERDWAEQAGITWIGKNGLAIDPEIGSWFFLSTIITDRSYAPSGSPMSDHCGTCRACIDACPTAAIVEPRTVDARRCISYRTIEHRGELPADATDLHGWLFGCDICQEVCPFNQRRGRQRPSVHPDLAPRDLPDDLTHLAEIDSQQFVDSFAGTPVMRTRAAGMRRNARHLLDDYRGGENRGGEK